MDTDRYAREQSLALRDDWQFSRIFCSPEARPGFTALLALRAEMQQVLAQASEPGLAAVKLEWWRNEIEQGLAGSAQHPLAQALGRHLGEAGIAAEYCQELVDAAETEMETASPFNEQDFQLYLYRAGGVLAEQLAMLSGNTDRKALNAARRLGQLKRFNDLLWSAGAMLRAGRWLFPVGWLEENELTLPGVLADTMDPRTRALQARMLASFDQARIDARTAMENVALPPALLLQWALLQKDHGRLRENPARMFAAEQDRGRGVARLWTAWRGARRAARDNQRNSRTRGRHAD